MWTVQLFECFDELILDFHLIKFRFKLIDELLLFNVVTSKLETLRADPEWIDQSLRIFGADFVDDMVDGFGFGLVQKCGQLTEPAEEHPAWDIGTVRDK